ncbi:LPXTG cell wall anchor domain-containing protein [Sphingobacterium arenae]|uniref:LPXTG cell wall anchor domain-containing protein n=1 Tax=Sphingobacterium arenae TaxID=1280598 RepID=A0ABR7Y1U2_9SPHI|nr:LPXTG cell wall anchor domain-containing protein [Sphingobacterium arenae]MBD1425272.1 LPXTG cell wall anchor domain-containing protein [Sphingobacterium arenae]
MRTMGFVIQDIPAEGKETSPTAAIIVGAIILLVIIIVLYRRQKRRFND